MAERNARQTAQRCRDPSSTQRAPKFSFHTNPDNVPLTYQASRSHSLVSALRCASNSTHFVSRGTSIFDGSPEMNHDVHLPNGFIPPFPAFRRRMLAAALRSWNVVVKSRLAMVLCRLVGQFLCRRVAKLPCIRKSHHIPPDDDLLLLRGGRGRRARRRRRHHFPGLCYYVASF